MNELPGILIADLRLEVRGQGEAASVLCSRDRSIHPQGLKPLNLGALLARLKLCPDENRSYGFLSVLTSGDPRGNPCVLLPDRETRGGFEISFCSSLPQATVARGRREFACPLDEVRKSVLELYFFLRSQIVFKAADSEVFQHRGRRGSSRFLF